MHSEYNHIDIQTSFIILIDIFLKYDKHKDIKKKKILITRISQIVHVTGVYDGSVVLIYPHAFVFFYECFLITTMKSLIIRFYIVFNLIQYQATLPCPICSPSPSLPLHRLRCPMGPPPEIVTKRKIKHPAQVSSKIKLCLGKFFYSILSHKKNLFCSRTALYEIFITKR